MCYNLPMKYKITKDAIIIDSAEDFNPKHICECGQMFRFWASGDTYIVASQNYVAKIEPHGSGYIISTANPRYFVKYFDLDYDYSAAKTELSRCPQLAEAIKFGGGIRIINANPLETIFEFIISANNNIKRIKQIVERLCAIGEDVVTTFGTYKAFPSVRDLANQPQEWYNTLGAGYRAGYLKATADFLATVDMDAICSMPSAELYAWLLKLKGVGPKVASCILLFGFGRREFFPVDTWVEQVYNNYFFAGQKSRKQIQTFFESSFKERSGLAQQYLFYFMRSLGK